MRPNEIQEPPYITDFGLERDPFSLAIEDDFIYTSPVWSQTLDLLQHAMLSNELFMLVTGKYGIGKTTLARELVKHLDDNYRICMVQGSPMQHVEQLRKRIYKDFGVSSSEDSLGSFKQLCEHLDNLDRDGQKALLIIDDAHELPPESLQFIMKLYELYKNEHRLVHIVLFSEPGIMSHLESASPGQAHSIVTQNLELQPLARKDTENYLHHRMAVAGFREDNLNGTPFTPSAIEIIFRNSSGFPFEINRQASKVLMKKSSDHDQQPPPPVPAPTVKGRMSAMAKLTIILVVAIAITILVIQDTINSLFEPDNSVQTIPAPEARAVTAPENRVNRDGAVAMIEPEKTVPEQSIPDTGAVNSDNIISLTDDKNTMGVMPMPQEQEPEQTRTDPVEPVTESPVMQTEPALADTEATTEPETLSDEKIVEKSQDAETPVTPEVTRSTIEEPPIKTPDTEPVIAEITPVTETEQKPADWLFQQQPWQYTIQILGATKKATIDKFLKQASLDAEPVIYKTTKNNRDWYMVFAGVYPDKQSAVTASTSLPDSVKKSTPWIRSIADIQMEVLNKKSVSAVASTSTSVPASSEMGKGNEWLLQQNPWRYTIQLLGSEQEKSLQEFIRQNKIENRTSVIRAQLNGKDWYVLILGNYPDEKTARTELTQLPTALKKTSPWPRTLGSLQAAVVEAHHDQ